MAQIYENLKDDILLQALGRLGIRNPNEAGAERTTAELYFELSLYSVLTAHRWQFATKRATLDSTPDAAVGDWLAGYDSTAMPEDFYAAQYIFPGSRNVSAEERIPFVVEGGVLLCDNDPIDLVYTADPYRRESIGPPAVTAAVLAPPYFADAVVWRLASELVLPLITKPEYLKATRDMYKEALSVAIVADLNERQEDPPPYPDFIRVRM